MAKKNPKHSIKNFVIERVDPKEFYLSRFPGWNPRVKTNVSCCFHSPDRKPSLAINLTNGGAHCFASSCGKSIGNIVHFEAQRTKVPEEIAALQIYDEFVRAIVPLKVIEAYHDELLKDERQQSAFTRSTGITIASIENFSIGFSRRASRFTFPVTDRFGNIVDIRFYRLKTQRKATDVKIYSLVEGKNTDQERRFGGLELFPRTNFNTYTTTKPLFLMASEKETILAIQLGLQAVCSTCGEGSWSEEWLEYFEGFDVGILFDADKGGRKAAAKLFATLQTRKHGRVVDLSLPFPSNYKGDTDFDDWIISKNGTIFSLLNLFNHYIETPTSLPSPSENAEEGATGLLAPAYIDDKVHSLTSIRSNVSFLNKSVKTRGIIQAVSSRTYDVPWRFKVKVKTGYIDCQIPVGRDLVSFVGASDSTITDRVSDRVGSVVKEWKAVEHITIAEVEVVPIAEVASDTEGKYAVQRCFLVGLSIDANTPYEFTVVPTTLIGTQEKVFVITQAEEIARAIDTWSFNKDDSKDFKIFQPKDESVEEKLYWLANEIAANFSKIYCRPDLHIVCLLTWFSPIGFYFPGESKLQRGWLNSLAFGDTQTGKSEVVATLQNSILKMGDIVNAENCTFVGLVGGAIKTGSGQMMLRWGRLPLCDRKLVALEELSGLSVHDISHMSEVRSRGIARLDKGGLASQTPARTRLIALSNVRSKHKNLAQYLSGVKALQELIGHPEDISRFDLIVTLIDKEVDSEIINSPADENVEAAFLPSQLQRLCQFAWALKPNQVQFSDDAYLQCLGWTKKLQDIYHPSVPIFKAASGRLLLARIGAAIATLQFSWDNESLRVEKEHIDAAVAILRSLYDKPSFGYFEYSEQLRDREKVKQEHDVKKAIKSFIKSELTKPVFESLIHAAKFTRDELQAIAGLQPFQADDLMGAMLRSNVLRKGEANTWEITPAGKAWLEKLIK